MTQTPLCTCESFPDRVCYCHHLNTIKHCKLNPCTLKHEHCYCRCPIDWPTRPQR